MDQSIFSLFTTKDWPFQSPNKATSHAHNDSEKIPHSQDTRAQAKNFMTAGRRLRTREETIDGMLFFDRLMKLGSIPNFEEIFPPSHPSRLRQLLDSIDACSFDLLKKNCLVYYLLKEYADGREARFAIDRLIPSHFTRGLDGLWALDHSQWQAAIRSMSDPTVTPDFLPEIIQTLATQPPPKVRSTYLMRFYQLTQPSLGLSSVKLVLRAMCTNCHLRSAWNLQRSYGQPEREQLLRLIFETCFGLNDCRQPLPRALQTLIRFPFDELEDSLLSRFAISSPKLLPESQSMVVVQFYLSKLTSEARYIEAIRFERELSQSARTGPNPDIDRVIRGIAEMIPEVQRNMLELEFDQQHPILNQIQASTETTQKSNEMYLGASYDVCSLAWDPPASPPPLPPPASLAEARTQQELLNPPKAAIARNSLPLSASPILRRTMPRMSLDKSNESQKTLLKALAYTRQPSAPNSPDPSQTLPPADELVDLNDLANTAGQTASRSTPRFTHFVGPSSRLPGSATKQPPPPPNFSTSFSRSTVTASGSPFHRLSFPDLNDKSPPSAPSAAPAPAGSGGDDRWPTRIVFTPRRPSSSQKTFEEKQIPKAAHPMARGPIPRNANHRREVREKSGDSSSSDSDNSHPQLLISNRRVPPPVGKQQFEAVVVPKESFRRQMPKSPPKKIARVNSKAYPTRRTPRAEVKKVLPGGFQMDDDDDEMVMEEPLDVVKSNLSDRSSPTAHQTSPRSDLEHPPTASNLLERSAKSSSRSIGMSTRKKINARNNHSSTQQSNNSNNPNLPPVTPRRSTRLHSTTPAKRSILPGGILDHHDSMEEDQDDDPPLSQEAGEKENDQHQLAHTTSTHQPGSRKTPTQTKTRSRKKVQHSSNK